MLIILIKKVFTQHKREGITPPKIFISYRIFQVRPIHQEYTLHQVLCHTDRIPVYTFHPRYVFHGQDEYILYIHSHDML